MIDIKLIINNIAIYNSKAHADTIVIRDIEANDGRYVNITKECLYLMLLALAKHLPCKIDNFFFETKDGVMMVDTRPKPTTKEDKGMQLDRWIEFE